MKAQYVAMFENGERGKNFFRFAYIEYPDTPNYIPPPKLELGVPMHGIHEFVLAEDQAAIARAFNTSQQNVSRWMHNSEPKR